MCERESVRERERVCVCVFVRERESHTLCKSVETATLLNRFSPEPGQYAQDECVCERERARERERQSVCLCECVCERERECVCLSAGRYAGPLAEHSDESPPS